MIIEIKGASFENYGAWLMLTSVIQRLDNIAPNALIVMAARGQATSQRRNELGALRKINLRARWLDLNGATRFIPGFLRNFLRRRGVVFECDLYAIIDIAGFAYSDQWGTNYAYAIRHAVAEAKRLRRRDRHYIFMPQAFGPFSQPSTRDLIREKLTYASLVAARDPVSYANIEDITGEFDGLVLRGDFTNTVDTSDVGNLQISNPCISKPYIVVVPNAHMLGEHSSHPQWSDRYVDVLSMAIEKASEIDLSVVLVNFGGLMDQALIDELQNKWPNAHQAAVASDLEAKALVAGATLAIASRYHACICALSSGVPCLGTSWSHKYEALYADYGVLKLLLRPHISADELADMIDEAFKPEANIRERLTERAGSLQSQTEELWKTVDDILSDPSTG